MLLILANAHANCPAVHRLLCHGFSIIVRKITLGTNCINLFEMDKKVDLGLRIYDLSYTMC